MVFEYIVEPENKSKSLSKEEENHYAKKIVDLYKDLDDARKDIIKLAKELQDEIYFKNTFKPKDSGKIDWKSRVKLCKMFMYFQTYKAFIWKNTYSGVNSMFDVSGENRDSDNDSNKQKAALVDILEKMDFSTISDKVIDYSLIYGELISFTTWVRKEEEFRRPVNMMEDLQEALTTGDTTNLGKSALARLKGKDYYTDTRTVYDNATIIPVNPENFVFDATQEDFDAAPKIYRTWKTLDEVRNNKCYELTKEQIKELKEMIYEPNQNDYGDLDDKDKDNNKHVHGTTVEVLDYYGNFVLDDHETLYNWHATVVGGQFLVLFEKNKYIINPFTYGTYFKDPKTGRGISPLYSGLNIALTQEKMLNQTIDLQSLNENKPILAPKGFFKGEEIEMYPGKIIEYDQQLYATASVQPLEFETTVYRDDISLLGDTMSEITGIFPNMTGNEENSRRTATEISTKVEGQTTRLSMTLDTIQQYYIIPAIENVAKMNANFKFGNETIFFNKDNKKEDIEITDKIRQAEYRYTYKDKQSLSEKMNFADMIILAIERFAKAGVPLDFQTTFTWYLEQKGVENPEKFLMQPDVIPAEVQQVLMQRPDIQQIVLGYQQQKQMEAQQNSSGEPMPSPENVQKELAHYNQSPTESPMVMNG